MYIYKLVKIIWPTHGEDFELEKNNGIPLFMQSQFQCCQYFVHKNVVDVKKRRLKLHLIFGKNVLRVVPPNIRMYSVHILTKMWITPSINVLVRSWISNKYYVVSQEAKYIVHFVRDENENRNWNTIIDNTCVCEITE